jgi:hypothetical protein
LSRAYDDDVYIREPQVLAANIVSLGAQAPQTFCRQGVSWDSKGQSSPWSSLQSEQLSIKGGRDARVNIVAQRHSMYPNVDA